MRAELATIDRPPPAKIIATAPSETVSLPCP
jgi:hypothetical protein